jgi:hypothetical protein
MFDGIPIQFFQDRHLLKALQKERPQQTKDEMIQ